MNLMDKYKNTKNNLQWSRQNPHFLHEISLQDMKVCVLYIPQVRRITRSELYAEMIISESGRYCTGASKTAPYSTAEVDYSKKGGNRHREKVTTWQSNQIASLYYNKQNIYSVNACDDTQSR
jgi:hypothetical protein